jgi:glucosamine-6-phosphate deaminase
MRIIIKKDTSEVGDWAATYIIDKIKKANPSKEKPFILGLPTGSSPLPVYKEFIRRHKAGEISFKNVITFNMDEYVGLPENHTERKETGFRPFIHALGE